MDIATTIVGALVSGFCVWNLVLAAVRFFTKYKLDKNVDLVISLFISFSITLIIGWFWYAPALFFHAPAILLFFFYDFFKNRKKSNNKKAAPL